ncbi:MAG: hypothetical protein WC800_07630 [Candidatus Nanopelagicaceae bacterium]
MKWPFVNQKLISTSINPNLFDPYFDNLNMLAQSPDIDVRALSVRTVTKRTSSAVPALSIDYLDVL